jgi:hypothetical protein
MFSLSIIGVDVGSEKGVQVGTSFILKAMILGD